MISCINKKLFAFTLAEVLIVIGIIGIIAETTIPTLIDNTNKQVAVTQIKKITSIINQAILLAKNDEVQLDTPITGSTQEEQNFFLPYFKVVKKCENGETQCGLINVLCLHGLDTGLSLTSADKRYVLSDGTFIGFKDDGDKYWIYVDINGSKKPNKMGYDVFMIPIKTNLNGIDGNIGIDHISSSLSTYDNDGQGCDKANTLSGKYCYNRIVFENYAIDYWK